MTQQPLLTLFSAGTHWGGLYALLLGRMHLSIDVCIEIHEKLSRAYNARYEGALGRMRRRAGSKYSTQAALALVEKCVFSELPDDAPYRLDSYCERAPQRCKT